MVLAYQLCASCVMDTSDPQIRFNSQGRCDQCEGFDREIRGPWLRACESGDLLEQLVEEIRFEGRGKEYDCLLGLSGGLDSSYMLHVLVRQFGLRPLVFHVDGGWNTELAVHNIMSMVTNLDLDLKTEVINWTEMRDFQLAFFKSGVPHIDIPQDHAFIGTLYRYAGRHRIRHILNGGNISTEVVRNPLTYFYYGTDMLHNRDIIRRFGTVPMKTYPFSSIYRHKVWLHQVRGVRVVKPLDLMPYRKEDAERELTSTYGWKPYPQKHFESRFTRFFEGHWLPSRFGFDVRRVQFSSLILTGQMSRDQALATLSTPSLSDEVVARERRYVATKLGVSEEEFDGYHRLPKRFYWDYRNQKTLFDIGARGFKLLGNKGLTKR